MRASTSSYRELTISVTCGYYGQSPMEQLFDLPAHPLFVHAPVVLMPLLTVLTLLVGARRQWRERAGWWLLAGAAVLLVGTLLAAQSGEGLDEAFDGAVDVERHEELAETTRLLVVGYFVAVAAMAATAWLGAKGEHKTGGRRTLPVVFAVAAMALGALGSVWMARTGHEGASITWCPGGDGTLCGPQAESD